MTSKSSSRPSALRAQHAEFTRDLILDALAHLIVERGLNDFSVQQVADQAGISHRTVCRYYPSRSDLLDALSEWLYQRFLSRTDSSEELLHEDLPARVVEKFSMLDDLAHHAKAYVLLAMRDRGARWDQLARSLRRTVESGPARHLEAGDASAVSALIGSLFSATFWYELTEKYGLDGATAGRAAAWAIATLFAELERGGRPPLSSQGR